jgi:hypothetical protein
VAGKFLGEAALMRDEDDEDEDMDEVSNVRPRECYEGLMF